MKQHRSIAVILALVMTFSCSACAAKQEASSHTSVSESTAVSDTVSISDLSTRVTGANRDDYDFTEKRWTISRRSVRIIRAEAFLINVDTTPSVTG